MSTPLLTIETISKHYGSQKALDQVSFSIQKGEILGLVGQNGAGKTTLIRILSGLIPPTSGTISKADNYKIGAIIESPVLYPNMSAKENLTYAALQIGIEQPNQRIAEVLELVGLAHVDDKKKVKDFSLGMRQRMAIALAILDFPDFLILDEPVNGLDPSGIKEMREIIHNLRDNYGITVLISSHILSELELVVDRFVILHKGRVIQDIDKSDLHHQVANQIVLATTNNDQAQVLLTEWGLEMTRSADAILLTPDKSVQEVINYLNQHAIEITAIYPSGSSFEDYYLSLLD
ncbi:ABC transporter ATP-binding protein [Streptococcus moroccensis]|uniref:ABC-2 type transport system ATP-binding protein n=1 Tax=Streptococcus moroccensis TaxID=1451356 RepID=A0ABT9YTR0_9STRE|nr:ABC transporter ATP-binding protein [Streptococcus moroccensis]MDQ0223140.1 ABC-2 type transport system ATP-binding protein [Streptococcus moroccensis]